MDTSAVDDEPVEQYTFEVQQEAKADAVDRVGRGRAFHIPVETRRELEEEEVSQEVTTRALAGEHFPSSLTAPESLTR